MKVVQIPIETNPEGWWYTALLSFISYADVARNTYPGQSYEVPGAVILELPAPVDLRVDHGLHGAVIGEDA